MSKHKKRKVLIISGSRGEYGYIKPVYKCMKKSKYLDPKILVTNMHLLPEFGSSQNEFKKDNIKIDYKAYMSLAGYTNTTMVKSLGIFLLSISDILSNETFDFILIAGDRGEQIIAAMAGAHLNIPVAHIQAGELSGNIDGMTRHAISRFAHIHFAANEDAKKRLIKMGEQPFRIFKSGAPQLDELINGEVVSNKVITEKFNLDLNKPVLLVLQHPVTEQSHLAMPQIKATFQAVIESGHQSVVIYPNNDSGSDAVREYITNNRHANIRMERNISRPIFSGLMRTSALIIGNSSSGILEAPSFKLPAINIGRRQNGRFQGENVINVAKHSKDDILKGIKKGLSKKFRNCLKNINNPYGDGFASQRIVEVLEHIPIDERLLFKNITY